MRDVGLVALVITLATVFTQISEWRTQDRNEILTVEPDTLKNELLSRVHEKFSRGFYPPGLQASKLANRGLEQARVIDSWKVAVFERQLQKKIGSGFYKTPGSQLAGRVFKKARAMNTVAVFDLQIHNFVANTPGNITDTVAVSSSCANVLLFGMVPFIGAAIVIVILPLLLLILGFVGKYIIFDIRNGAGSNSAFCVCR
jgi:hypothetical protein